MRLLLVSIHTSPSPQAVPLANAFLKACLTDIPLQSSLVDFFLDDPTDECVEKLLGLQPDAIGFSIYLWNRADCRRIAIELKKKKPELVLFAGGPETTADPYGILDEMPLDFTVVGEGETCIADICGRLAVRTDVAGVPGVVVRGTDRKKNIPAKPPIELDTIPSPWLSGVLDAADFKGILWQLSRGCSFGCDFCFDAREGRNVRRFSLERIEAELKLFVRKGVSQVFVLDSTFNQDLKRAKTILRMIRKLAPDIHFHFEIRSEFIDQEMAQLFADIICSLQIGLQSADPEVLKQVGRTFRRDDFSRKIGLLNESGAVFGFDLMYGLPGDTLQGFRESIDYALRLYPNHLDIFPLAILPGTALAARAEALDICYQTAPPYTLLSSSTFSEEAMRQAGKLANACDIFYTRGKSVAWFNSLATALRQTPSGFLHDCGEWLCHERGDKIVETDLEDHEIRLLQRKFLQKVCDSKKRARLLPLALDLLDYHYYYAAALFSGLPDAPSPLHGKENLLNMSGTLSKSAQLAAFNFDIQDILDAGEPDLRSFTSHHAPTGSWAVIYPSADGICTESLPEPYFRILENLDASIPFGKVTADNGVPDQEALPFLRFCIQERIILPTCKSTKAANKIKNRKMLLFQ